MASRIRLTLREDNDETLFLTITRDLASDDLTVVTTLQLYLKDDSCQPDSAALVLTSAIPAQIQITSQTAAQITATAFIPASALADPYDRVWRVDGLDGTGRRRTAMYGPVTVVDL